jgi:hypothetical protein
MQTLSLDTSGADNINNHGALYGGAGRKLTAAARLPSTTGRARP